MKYSDGRDAKLGDQVALRDDSGVLVCSFDTDEYGDEHPESEWRYLKKGILIAFNKNGLIHYEEAEPELYLVKRINS
jgi:hypothetical protein